MGDLKKRAALCVASTLGALAVTFLLGVHPTEAQTVVSSSTTFTDDPPCMPGGVCVDITASRIQVNGAGHVVDCSGSGVGIRIGNAIMGQTRVHLHSFEVRNCSVGVLVQGGGNHHLNELNVHDNVSTATISVVPPPLALGDGFQLDKTTNNHVNGSQSRRNDAFGVRLIESHGNSFNTMVVVWNVGLPAPPTDGASGGYRVDHSNGNVITSNDISNNGAVGVWILDSSDNIVRGSVVNNTSFYGLGPATAIALTGDSDGNIIRGNQTNMNQNGISLGCPTFCLLISLSSTLGADNNIVKSNTSLANVNDGIQVGLTNTTNVLQGNTALTNLGLDLRDDNPGCDANLWKGNTFVTSNNSGCIR